MAVANLPGPGPGGTHDAPLIRLEGVGKRFPGTYALKPTDLDIRAGEVLGVVGENGAGKSTLIKILTGATRRSEGAILVDGVARDVATPSEAQGLGLNAVHQEVVLCPHLSVAANIFLGLERATAGLLARRAMDAEAQAVLGDLGFRIDARAELGSLTIGQQQLVATARATLRRSRLIIFDEPTAYLSRQETDQLFRLIRRLGAGGVAILYISHRLEEVFELCARVAVLRDGRLVADRPTAGTTEAQLIRDMVSRDVGDVHYKEAVAPGEPILAVRGLSGPGFENVDLDLRRGEVLGLFGLIGAGRSELVHALYGRTRITSGTMILKGAPYAPRSVADALAAGFALVPESRRLQGLCLNQSVTFNTALPVYPRLSRWGIVRRGAERAVAAGQARALRLAAPSLDAEVLSLSGGNQQKVVIGRWIAHGAAIYVFDEPTAGVDVATKREIYQIMAGLLRGGAAVILISSYLPEVHDLADRLVVMYRGRVAQVFDEPRRAGHDAVLAAALGEGRSPTKEAAHAH
jgi:ribose transport system ATP-binding protein